MRPDDDQNQIKFMKICISSSGSDLESPLDPRFGRAPYFLIIDGRGKLVKALENTGVQAMRGAGISAAQLVAQEKVEAVISGNIGPRAYSVLSNLGIKIFLGNPAGKAKDIFKDYKEGKLKETDGASF